MAWRAILGQPTAVRLLQSDLIRNRLASAYLLVGPEGVGKRMRAVELAKAVQCDVPLEGPCDQCPNCRRVIRGVHPDVHVLIPQGTAAMISIDDVRWILERVALRPFTGPRSMIIVDGAHRLTEEAANSLLKVLEEPPGQATFLLITSQPASCLPTILSRCRIVRFQPFRREADDTVQADRPIYIHLAAGQANAWVTWAVPKERETLSRWLDASIEWLRDVAVASVVVPTRRGQPSLVRHVEEYGAIERQAQTLPRERCIGTAFRLMELKRSFEEQMISPRLIGTLLRESWIGLLSESVSSE
jgi:DNA polymerase III delta' subunit